MKTLCRSRFIAALLIGTALLLALSACSLAGDETPPPDARRVTVADLPAAPSAEQPALSDAPIEPVDVNTAVPAALPSAVDGALIYAQHCAACHGAAGKGDGERGLQLLAERTEPLPDFSTPDLARQRSPVEWFKTVTEGRLEKFMPPWANALSESERWSVVAYLYALSTPAETIESGQQVYAANCTACHGAAGQGDGPEAEAALQDLTALPYMVKASPAAFFAAVTTGAATTGSAIANHAFESELSEAERWAAVNYVQTFAYAYFAPGAPLPEQLGAVKGLVTNGTADARVPENLEVRLLGFDEQNMIGPITATARADGSFELADIPFNATRQFILTTDYQEVTYHSDVFAIADTQTPAEVPLQVYETTEAADAIRVERVHNFVIFEEPGLVTMGQLYLISNDGDKVYAPADGRTVQFQLPTGATDFAVQDGEENVNYFRTEAGFVDARPVLPGPSSLQVLYSFKLPYAGALDFEQKMLYPVSEVDVLVGDAGLTLEGDQFQNQGLQDMQGMTFQSFTRTGLSAGDTLQFSLSGTPGAAAASTTPGGLAPTDTTSLAIGLGAVAVVLLGVGVWWRFAGRSSAKSDDGMSDDDLLQAMAELDDDFESGQVAQRDYERERAWLKGKLVKLMGDE